MEARLPSPYLAAAAAALPPLLVTAFLSSLVAVELPPSLVRRDRGPGCEGRRQAMTCVHERLRAPRARREQPLPAAIQWERSARTPARTTPPPTARPAEAREELPRAAPAPPPAPPPPRRHRPPCVPPPPRPRRPQHSPPAPTPASWGAGPRARTRDREHGAARRSAAVVARVVRPLRPLGLHRARQPRQQGVRAAHRRDSWRWLLQVREEVAREDVLKMPAG